MRTNAKVVGGSHHVVGLLVIGLGVTSACRGIGDMDPPDAAIDCERFETEAASAWIRRTHDGFIFFAHAPASLQAQSVSYSITDGTTETSGEVSGDEAIRVEVITASEGPWTATLIYRRAGCDDRTVVHDLDLTPPAPISAPAAAGGIYSVTLDWIPPGDPDFEDVSVYMRVGSPPSGRDDPEAVGLCNVLGSGMLVRCGAPTAEWFGIPAGEVYFTFYAVDTSGNASEGVTTSTTIGGVAAWQSVTACETAGFGIAADGTLWAWGAAVGRTGRYSPVAPVQLGSESDWERVACGMTHVVALRADGRLFGWGPAAARSLEPTQIGDATDWTDIAAGRDHSLAIRSPGTLWAWGGNQRGQLGDGTTTLRDAPVRVGTDSDWLTIAAGATHSLAIKQDGSLWAFGGGFGNTPVRIGDASDWRAVAAGYSSSFGIRDSGTLFRWGTSGASDPEPIGAGANWTRVSVYYDALALQADGSLWVIPFGGTDPMQLAPGIVWGTAAAGPELAQALTVEGARYAWGQNVRGELGDGSFVPRAEPTAIP